MSLSLSPINASRLRSLPKFYSWIDHRLVHCNFLKRISPEAATLYLFLLTVSDRCGMSYYSDRAVYKRININNIFTARKELIDGDLISYAKPIYQVLSLVEERVLPEKKQVVDKHSESPASKEEIAKMFNQFRGVSK